MVSSLCVVQRFIHQMATKLRIQVWYQQLLSVPVLMICHNLKLLTTWRNDQYTTELQLNLCQKKVSFSFDYLRWNREQKAVLSLRHIIQELHQCLTKLNTQLTVDEMKSNRAITENVMFVERLKVLQYPWASEAVAMEKKLHPVQWHHTSTETDLQQIHLVVNSNNISMTINYVE